MASLAEFLKEQAHHLRDPEPQRQKRREEWIKAVERLIGQMETWLREADPDKVLHVERGTVDKREYGLGNYVVPTLTIHLGDCQVDVIPDARNVLGPLGSGLFNHRAEGLVNITDGIYKYRLYRYLAPGGEHWVIVDDEEYIPVPFDRGSFEAAVLKLLK